jgi:predicted nucleotidyltransferase
LEALVGSGILLRRRDGRRIYYKANTESPFFPEMRGPIEKTAGILPALKAELIRFDDRIELALMYGSVARGEERSGSDVDLMIVGSLKHVDLLSALRRLESRFRREVNVTLFSSEEFHPNWLWETTSLKRC